MAATLTPEARARRIKVLLYDVDGVLTNGDITILPPQDANPEANATGAFSHATGAFSHAVEVKSFSAHDGMGISIARLAGLKIGWVTKRNSQVVSIRARDLKIDHVYQGQHHKADALNKIVAAESCTLDEVAYVGDDIIDLPVMRVVGFAIAPANARPEAKAAAHYLTPNPGGQGAGRDAIDFILNAKGILNQTIEQYLDPNNPAAQAADIGAGNM